MAEIKTKFINDPEQVTPELLEGYVLAYPDQVKLAAENVVVRANPKSEDKVAIVAIVRCSSHTAGPKITFASFSASSSEGTV